MAVRFKTFRKPVVQGRWSVAIPHVGGSVESDVFRWKEVDWKFKLETTWSEWNTDEEWRMYIMECGKVAHKERLFATVYVRDGMSNLYLAHAEIFPRTTALWSYVQRSFLNSYPGIKVTDVLDFSFEFETLRTVSTSFANEHKAVQTPRRIVPPSYSEDRPCLDNLSLALRKLVDEGSNSDVQLKCGEVSVAAHALILGMRSEVFRTMLQSDMQERREGAIEIVDMEPKAFEIFIRYLYTGTLPELAEDTAVSLYEAADKYLVQALRERCGYIMVKNLTRENALKILAMVDAHSDKDLKDKVVTYVLDEKIPGNEDEWSKFCDDYPKLAVEVLNRSYKQ